MRYRLAGVGLVGAVLRAPQVFAQPSSDAIAYVALAAERSLAAPWAASYREPLWILLVKVATAPFGYTVEAAQWFSVVCAIASLYAMARLLRECEIGEWGRLIGLAVVAIHPLLVIDAGSGIRESMTLLISILIVRGLLTEQRAVTALLVAGLVGIRWELGLVWLVVLAFGVLARRVDWRTLALALAVGAVIIGPFMVANAREHSDPLYHSNRLAMYFRNIEDARAQGLNPFELPRFRGEPITWTEYHFEYVGAKETLRRATEGAIRVPARVAGFGLGEHLGLFVLAFAALGAMARPSPTTIGSLLFIALVTAGYAPLWWTLAMRVVSILVLPIALLAAISVDVIQDLTERRRYPTSNTAPSS